MVTKDDLLRVAETIRTQTRENGNTAELVGSLLKNIINYIAYSDENIVNSAIRQAIDEIMPGDGESIVFDGVKSGTYNEGNGTIELMNVAGEVISIIDLSPLINACGLGVVEEDFSNFELSNNYINEVFDVLSSPTGRYRTTGYIRVYEGDTVIFSGHRSLGLPVVVGYSDNQGNGATALLGSLDRNDPTYIFNNAEVPIPAGINFIRCSARAQGIDNAPAMTVIVRRANSSSSGGGDSQSTTTIINQVADFPRSVYLPRDKKIMILGASFAVTSNGWDKLVQDMTGLSIVNKAAGGTSIKDLAAQMLIMNENRTNYPHSKLFWSNGKDTFNDYGAIIIDHVHNQDVCLDEATYQARSLETYKANTSLATGSYAGAFDFVIKQLKAWCDEYSTSTTEIIERGNARQRTIRKDYPNNQIQILICSHWHPGRKTYNESSRKLAVRHNVAYCELDKELGFKADDNVQATILTDQSPDTPVAGLYNRSVLHAQFVNISTSTNKPVGRTETIDGKVWGFHPMTVSYEVNYGYGKMTMANGDKVFVPWLQWAIATAVAKCIRTMPFSIKEYENPWIDINLYPTPTEEEPEEWSAIRQENYYYNGEIGSRNQVINISLQDEYLENINTGSFAYPLSADNLYLRLNSAVENGKVPILKAKLKRPNGTYVDVLITMFKDENDIFTGTQELSNGHIADATVSNNGTQNIVYSLNQ